MHYIWIHYDMKYYKKPAILLKLEHSFKIFIHNRRPKDCHDNQSIRQLLWILWRRWPWDKKVLHAYHCIDFTLTHSDRDKMVNIFWKTFSNAFSWMKMYEFQLRFHWRLFLRVQLTVSQHWFKQWLGADQATSHCLNQWWLVYWRIY